MDNIIVEIPCIGEYNGEVYVKPKTCYLAQALNKIGYTDAVVGPYGSCSINGKRYKARESFGPHALKEAFKEQKTLIVELIPN